MRMVPTCIFTPILAPQSRLIAEFITCLREEARLQEKRWRRCWVARRDVEQDRQSAQVDSVASEGSNCAGQENAYACPTLRGAAMRHAIIGALIACLFSPDAFAAEAVDPVTLPITPNGSGDPGTIVCRTPQRIADGGQFGPKICLSNHEWRQMASNGKNLAPDGKTLIDLPIMDNPKGEGDPDAVTCRTPVDLQMTDRIRHFGPKVCQPNHFWADIIKNHQMVDALGVVRATSVTSMGNGGDPFHNPTSGMGRSMGNSGAPF
jgi:hypothetical protein